jgi:hypothetical protein
MARTETNDDNWTRRNSLRELRYAGIATALTLVAATAFYLYVPVLRDSMQERAAEIVHGRYYAETPSGGEIEYRLNEAGESRGMDPALAAEGYQRDLEILARRFQRGQFAMVVLSGMENTPEYQAMVRNQASLQYTVERRENSVALVIRANNPAAVQAVHAYLAYLKPNWVFRKRG